MNDERLLALHELRESGPLPDDLEREYQAYRADLLLGFGQADGAAPPVLSPSAKPKMRTSDWIKLRWASADASVRHSLRTIAASLGMSLPLTRTRQASTTESDGGVSREAQDRRTDPDLQAIADREPCTRKPEQVSEPYEGSWADDDAPGWEPCTSLHDALHPEEDRGWY